MSKLDELINKLCPNGVEYKTLGEVAIIKNGKDYKHLKDGDIPVYGSGGIMTYVDTAVYSKPTVLIPRKGSLNNLFYVDVPFWNVDTIFYTEINIKVVVPKFLYYFLAKSHLEDLNKAGGVPSLTQSILNKVIIPVPPLPVQEEIVRILDTFTSLTAELTAELTARRKQYEYYRDSLLTFGDDVEWKTIGSITNVFSAKRVYREQWQKEGIPFWRSSDLISYFNGVENTRGKAYISQDLYEALSSISGKIQKDDILITGGGTIGIPYIVPNNEPLYVKDGDLLCIQHNESLDSKFLYHYFLSNQFKKYLSEITHDATIAHYTIIQIRNTPVPIPSMDKQKKIGTVLDRFESLCNDITSGLPAEIEVRQKQYEYYRDKLLSFKRKEAV
ncbi:MAG TPA: restriction endonuclease subunit S [Treponema sp.]|nr:restriction endonuclease subunit S [Treponema sp.]